MTPRTPDSVAAYPLPPLGQRVVFVELPGQQAKLGIHHGLILDERGDTLAIVNIDGENQLRALHFSRVKPAIAWKEPCLSG